MLNRRHLRIKVLQQLYAFTQSDDQNYVAAERDLLSSLNRMYELYLLYLLVLPEIVRQSSNKLEDKKRKARPTAEELNPNMNFVNNAFIAIIDDNITLRSKSKTLKADWVGDVKQDIIKKLLIHIEDTDLYKEYMKLEAPTFTEDKDFALKLLKNEVCNFQLLLNYFDEERVNWHDDYDHVFSMTLKSLKFVAKTDTESARFVMDLFKDDEEEYAKVLFRKTIINFDAQTEFLGKYTKNWDAERLAKMDILIMNLAITEAKEFSSIPLKVTLNEYIEIAKFYSTPKSSTFINGVLDKVFEDLSKTGELKKIGRGLV